MPVYNCSLCQLVTPIKCHYERHLLTKKHMMNEKVSLKSSQSHPKVIPKSSQIWVTGATPNEVQKKEFVCKFCHIQFAFKQTMYRHMKNSCTKKEDDYKELVRLLNTQIENQKKEFEEEKEERKKETLALVKQIEALKGKLEIKGSFNTSNSNNTINNVQNITLNYVDTDVSHLTDKDYRCCIRKVCHSVLRLIEKIHFNPAKPENMNVYISNMRDKYVMVYEGNKWVLKNKTETIDTLYTDKEMMLEEWMNDNEEPEMRKFFDRYMTNVKVKSTMDDINDQLKLMLYNKKDLIENI